jgi:hypothetical protein
MGNSETLKQIDGKLLEYLHQDSLLSVHCFLVYADQTALRRLDQSFQYLILLLTQAEVEEQFLREVFRWWAILIVSLLIIYKGMLVHCHLKRVDQLLYLLLIVFQLQLFFLIRMAPDGVCLYLFLLELVIRDSVRIRLFLDILIFYFNWLLLLNRDGSGIDCQYLLYELVQFY